MSNSRKCLAGIGICFVFMILAPLMGIGESFGAEKQWAPKHIEIVMPHKVGSNQDMVTRILGDAWSKRLGIPFIYSNKPGASGQIGYNYFMTRPQDGTTLLSTNLASAVIMYKEQQKNLPWKWEEALEWMGLFGVDPGTIFVRAESPFKTIQELIAAAKTQKLRVAISYWASPDNLLMHQLMQQTGAQFEIIPYGSGNDLVTQVVGGHVDFGFTKVSGVEKTGGMLRHLAISMAENPIPEMTNDAPSLDKALGTKTLGVSSYRSINIPKQLRTKYPDRYERIKKAFYEAKRDPEVIKAMERAGVSAKLFGLDWETEQLEEQTRLYWDAYEANKSLYEKKK